MQCYKYRIAFDQTSRNRMREKVTASIIFRDRKASYAKSVSHPFHGDYVRLRQNVQWKKICTDTNDQYVVFADIINKITRSSGKVHIKNVFLVKIFSFVLLYSLFQFYWYYRQTQCCYLINEHYKLNIEYQLVKFIVCLLVHI